MDSEKNTYQPSSSSGSSRQYYLEKRKEPDFREMMKDEALMQKKGRNAWHYLAMADAIFKGETGDWKGRKYEIGDTGDEYKIDWQDINAQDRYGNTPLHYAYAHNNGKYDRGITHTINALLAKGANPEIRNNMGQKPGEYKLSGLASLKHSIVKALPNAWMTSAATFISSVKSTETAAIPTSVTQEQFVAEVKKFKQAYNVKSLRDEVFSPLGRPLYERFITNSVIFAWLTRPFEMVQLRKDGIPMVDKYELEFYDGIALYPEQLCGFHATIDARAMLGYGDMDGYNIWGYYGGLSPETSIGLANATKTAGGEEKGVSVKFPLDIYRAGYDALGGYNSRTFPQNMLLSMANMTRANKYTIYWTAKNETGSAHQITCVTRFDDKGTAAAVFLLNSWQDNEPEVAKKEVEIDGDDQELEDDEPEITNPFLAENTYSKYLQSRFRHNTYRDNEPVPYTWIDVSHNIQAADGDGNCVIYSLNFAKAIKEFLTTPASRAQMDTLCNAKQYKEAGTYLSNGIKALMPQYYTKGEGDTMVTVSPEALKAYHLRYRWELGNEAIHRLHDLAVV